MKRLAVAVTVALVALTACSSSSPPSGAGKTVTLAIGGPFSGSEKATGDQLRRGAQLARDQINAAGGIKSGPLKGAQLALKEFDDADDPQQATTQIRKVADDTSVLAFVGSALSDAAVASAPVADAAGLPYLAAYASSPTILEPLRKSVFVVPPTFPAYSFSVADELVKAGKKKPAILHLTGTYGNVIAQYVAQRLDAKGAPLVANETFTFTDTDFRTQLGKIKQAAPDSLVIVGLVNSDALILTQADELGLKVPAFDPGGITGNDDFLKAAGPLAEGLVGNTPTDALRSTAAAKALAAAYQKATGETLVPDPAAFAYEGVLAVQKALEAGASDRASLTAQLHQIKIDDTGIGPLSFSASGARLGGRLWIFKVKGGKLVFSTGYEQTGPTDIKEIPLERA